MKKKAFVFPGQGAQKPFMGHSFYEKFVEARMIYEEAEDLLSMNITKLLFSSDEEALKQTDFCQIALFTTSLAILEVVKKEFPDFEARVCGGLSLGEYSALVASQKVDYRTLLPVVKKRADFMHAAAQKSPQGMSAVLGLSADKIPSKYEIANLNAPGQVVIAGRLEDMQKAGSELKKLGARRVVPLKVTGAFHTSFMTEASKRLTPFVEELEIKDTDIDLVLNVSGQLAEDNDEMKKALVDQVHKKTRWLDCMKTMNSMDVDYIECGPKQLSSLNKKMDTVNSFITIEEVKNLEELYEKV